MCIVSRGALALHPDWPTETLGGKQPGQSPCSRQVLTLVPSRSLPSSELGCGGCEAVGNVCQPPLCLGTEWAAFEQSCVVFRVETHVEVGEPSARATVDWRGITVCGQAHLT